MRVRRQQRVFQVENGDEDLHFLNVITTLFYRLSNLDLVFHEWSHAYLHLSAFYGWYDLIGPLLKLGGNPDIQDPKGWTPLHAACASVEEGSMEAIQVLLKYGADPNLRADVTGFAPIHHLIEASRDAAEPWDCNGKLETLLKGGADINALDTQGRAPIHLASCIPWCNSVFALLHKRRARLDLLDVMGRSILHYAAMYGDLDHISYLRKVRLTEPDPDGKDANNQTPLDWIVWRKNAKLEELWKNMKRPTEEEIKAFRSLIEEIRIHRWQDANGGLSFPSYGSCWPVVKPEDHLNPREHLIGLPIRQKRKPTPPPSIEQKSSDHDMLDIRGH
ncbi:hypothetical protein FMUND_2193 [Fusarium mundagurra]|uniref:Ankyrin n=1 Tax=Fusarium mundagurra TaxID=1567541 RepID=A0A8H5Z4T3_9HYPO|nr:hypothetical protein FMUND_2193 [Fusarium mundagurra]